MIFYRPANTRGHLKNDWIESRRTFSNNSYLDFRYMNFGDLLVINDDIVQPNNFVPWHEHINVEILGYVVQGPCYHKDSLENSVEIPSGWVQRMSSGKSIKHMEGNKSDHPIRYLQLWIKPNIKNTNAVYSARPFSDEEKENRFCLIAGPSGPIEIKQDAYVYAGIFTEEFRYNLDVNRRHYLYVVNGQCILNGQPMFEGDGCSFEHESELRLTIPNCELLLFDLSLDK